MNMCLLEVSMCEKCKSRYFQSEGGSKRFEEWGGLKKFRTGGEGYRFGLGITFAGGVSTPLHAMALSNKS